MAEFYGSPPVVAQPAKVLVDIVDVAPGEFVVDLATGTAPTLMPAAHTGAAGIVGVDRSLGMLNVAVRRVRPYAI